MEDLRQAKIFLAIRKPPHKSRGVFQKRLPRSTKSGGSGQTVIAANFDGGFSNNTKPMKTLTTTWTGIRPLIMSNPQTVEIANPFAVNSRRINSLLKAARKRGDENRMAELADEQKRGDWEASAYWDKSAKRFYLPDTCLLACIRNGAVATKKGKDIDRAVIISETEAVVETEIKHNTLDAYYEDAAFRMECPAKVPPKTGALIWKVRCMMPVGWKVSFSIEYDESIVAEKSLKEALELAGRLSGIGGWRPKFGRFLVS